MTPEERKQAFVAFIVGVLIVLITIISLAFDWLNRYTAACEARGGVTVKTSVYTIDCFDLKALRR